MHPGARPKPHAARRGLTLIELMIALGIAAVLMTLAVPSFSTYLQRHRLKAAAQGLEADLREARYEAVRRGLPVQLSFSGGADWCYAITTAPDCDCRSARPCRLRAVRAGDLRGVQLAQSQGTRFDPISGLPEHAGAGAVWAVPGGERIRVSVNALGRPELCMVEGQMVPFGAC